MNPEKKENPPQKKGFFSKWLEKLDQKLEEKAKKRGGKCCGGGNGEKSCCSE